MDPINRLGFFISYNWDTIIVCGVKHHDEELADIAVRKAHRFELRIAAKAKGPQVPYADTRLLHCLAYGDRFQILSLLSVAARNTPDIEVAPMLHQDASVAPLDHHTRTWNQDTC